MKSSISITVRWEPVDCRHRNGEIIGYFVRYGEERGGKIRINPLGDSNGGMTTISGLTKQTIYTVDVAARTSTSDTSSLTYSDPHTIETPDSKQQSLILTPLICIT